MKDGNRDEKVIDVDVALEDVWRKGGELVENTIWEGGESVVVEEMKGMRV